ncbi:MAG TPA: FUSC family protein, partial [Stellaceae bacterium]|nr:FUSC family protein [Stellaceae bacterium]
MNGVAGVRPDRVSAFLHTQLSANPPRVRAFLRTEVALLLATLVAVTFKPSASYWIVVYLLLVSSPVVGNSVLDAVQRFYSSVVGCAVTVLVIIMALDEPWIYRPLQAVLIGLALFIARATPLGPLALTAGTTFAIISGSDVGEPPEGLITLSFYRILHAVIGSAIGSFAQLTFWPDDPLAVLKLSLSRQMAEVDSCLRGEPVALDAARVVRHFELLANAQVRHPDLLHRRAEIGELILDVGRVVDETLRWRVQ